MDFKDFLLLFIYDKELGNLKTTFPKLETNSATSKLHLFCLGSIRLQLKRIFWKILFIY